MMSFSKKVRNLINHIQRLNAGQSLRIASKNEEALKLATEQIGMTPDLFNIEYDSDDHDLIFTLKPKKQPDSLYQDSILEQNRVTKFMGNCIKAGMSQQKTLLLLYPNTEKESNNYQKFVHMFKEVKARIQ